jgi:uncharacterized protein with NRDE domain
MCTLIALHRCVAGAPLVVAANRDEFSGRPSEGPALRDTANGIILAPRDLRAGGTWLGVTSTGLFAALTNRVCASPDASRRSRGLLVLDALSAASASEAAERFERLSADAYNPFNLFLADRDTAHVVSYADAPERFDLQPGAHAIGNARPGDRTPKLERQRKWAEEVVGAPADRVLDRLADICRNHEGEDAISATCVHGSAYATQSSTLLRMDEPSGSGELRYLEGTPCTSAYTDFTPLLWRLGLQSGSITGESSMRKDR